MKKFLAGMFTTLLLCLSLPFADAQGVSLEPDTIDAASSLEVTPIITSRSEIQVGKKLILDASQSEVPDDRPVTYKWFFSDGNVEEGVEVVHIFDDYGKQKVELQILVDSYAFSETKEIFSYKQAVSFFFNGDTDTFESNIESVQELAESNGVFLNILASTADTPLVTEGAIIKEFQSKADIIARSEVLIGGPNGTNFLSALSKLSASAKNNDDDSLLNFKDKHIIVTVNNNMWLFQRIASRLVGLLNPSSLMIVEEAPFSVINTYLQSESVENFTKRLPKDQHTELSIETAQSSPLDFLARPINSAINNGVPTHIITFILFIPLILTIIAFFKQFIGVETLGVFQTIVLTLSIYILGLKFGTLVLAFTIVVGVISRYMLSKVKLMYIPRVTLSVSIVSILLLALIIVSSHFDIFFGIDTSSSQRALLSIFPMILIGVQADKLAALIVKKKGNIRELIALVATFVEILIAYLIISSPDIETLLFAIPELIIFAFILQYMLGRYTGLRLVEYIRFQELFRHDIEE